MKDFLNKHTGNAVNAVLLLGLIFVFLQNILAVRFIQDDAYTSFRYVKNFVNGNGLVFNLGEKVEGYTNFLWVMMLSLPAYLAKIFSFDFNIQNAAQVLSIFFSCVVIIETYVLSKIIRINEADAKFPRTLLQIIENVIPPFLMAFATPLLYWGVSAMETSMFVSLTILSIILYLEKSNYDKPNILFVIVSMLNSFIRPEGIIFFAIIMIHNLAINYLVNHQGTFIRRVLNSFKKKFLHEILFYTIPILLYIGFRLIYYGYPLPNTYYAKTEFTFEFISRGWSYFTHFSNQYLMHGILLILPLVLFIDSKVKKEILLLYGFAVTWIMLVIIIGGDVLPISRFFLPVMPIIFVIAVKAAIHLVNKFVSTKIYLNYTCRVLLVAAIIVWGINAYNKSYPETMNKRAYELGLVTKMKIYASWISRQTEITKHKPRVAMSTIGAFSYYSDADIIDIVGLTNSYIAHHPQEIDGINNELPVLWKERHYNAQYVMAQKPDYIIFPAGAKPTAFAECALFVQPKFKQNYYTQVFFSEELNQLLPVFTLRKLMNVPDDTISTSCSIKFLKHYILADNYFLGMIQNGNSTELNQVIKECDSVEIFCPIRKYDAMAIKAYAFYHAGKIKEAEKYLVDVTQNDPYNAVAQFYLKDIYVKENKIRLAENILPRIKKYSPGALPFYTF